MIGRRAILKALGVAPAAAPAVAAALTSVASGVSIGVGALVGNPIQDVPTPYNSRDVRKFYSFAEWLAGGGAREAHDATRNVSCFDPDIASMALPLNTKFMWQRKRNYERHLEWRRGWFDRRMSSLGLGFVEDNF